MVPGAAVAAGEAASGANYSKTTKLFVKDQSSGYEPAGARARIQPAVASASRFEFPA